VRWDPSLSQKKKKKKKKKKKGTVVLPAVRPALDLAADPYLVLFKAQQGPILFILRMHRFTNDIFQSTISSMGGGVEQMAREGWLFDLGLSVGGPGSSIREPEKVPCTDGQLNSLMPHVSTFYPAVFFY
jgi:hypothetical protein